MRETLPDCQGLSYEERWQCVSIDGEVVQSIALPLQNKSAPQQSCAALKIMLHVLLKETKGYTSSRNVLNLTFFEKDAAIPTHLGVLSFQ